MRTAAFYLLLALAAAGLLLAPQLVVAAPPEATMGLVQRIFYYHVPTAWLTFLSVFVAAGGAGAYLFRGSRRGDALAVAAAELAVLFGLCVVVTGPLWARKAWGVWWVWKDVRLITTLVLWVVFLAYLLVRRLGGTSAPRLSAGLALFAAIDVPLVYVSVFFWRTQHPKAQVVSTLDPAMRPALFVSLATFTLLWSLLIALRYRQERARQRLADAAMEIEDRLEGARA